MNLTGVNGNVNMSGWGDDNPDNERRKAISDHSPFLDVVSLFLQHLFRTTGCYQLKLANSISLTRKNHLGNNPLNLDVVFGVVFGVETEYCLILSRPM